ncbi:MAG: DUF1460 domain-containing protein [Deltaproteobacteria bacterium]|nr:DUF1460 domain-containing protein [Deltaproteobacteria bacterium]
MSSSILDAMLFGKKSDSLEGRINFWSNFFMNVHYQADPMGEGTGIDSDPSWNPCAMDCETYVETVVALSFSHNSKEVMNWVDKTRYYEGIRKNSHRFFTMNLSWIPENVKLGYLKNVNKKITNIQGKIGHIVVPEAHWSKEWKERFVHMGKYAPRGLSMVKYIPLSELIGVFKKIPVPSVAFLVGSTQSTNPFLITHMGFILKNPEGKIVFRHASGTPGRLRVEERDLLEYLKMLKSYFGRKNRRFILGMDIYQIIPPENLKSSENLS